MSIWKITITGSTLPVRAFILFKEKNNASGALEYAKEQAVELLGAEDAEACAYIVQEQEPI